MAESYRGLTIRIGGDTSKLTKALKTTNGAITQTQLELRKVGQALKLDPGNIEAFNQQMGYMANQATNTAAKLTMLKRTQEQMRGMNISLSTGETGTVESFARATAEFGGEVENVAGRLATAQTRFNQLTSTLATMHNEVTDLAKDMAKVRQQRIVDAFDLASGKKSVDDIRDAFATLPDGTERAKDAVDEYVASVERIAEVSKRVATSSGSDQKKAAQELRGLLRNDAEHSDGTSMSSSAITGLIDTLKTYGDEYQKMVTETVSGNAEMEASQKATEDRLLASHRQYFQERTAAYKAAMEANKQQAEEENERRNELFAAADAQLAKLREQEAARKKASDAEIAGYDKQISAIDRQLESLGKVVVTEESIRQKIEQVTKARDAQRSTYSEQKGSIESKISEWQAERSRLESLLAKAESGEEVGIDVDSVKRSLEEISSTLEELGQKRQKLIADNRSAVAGYSGELKKLNNDLKRIQEVGEGEFNEKYRRRSAEEIALGKEKVAVEKQRKAAIDESTKAEESFNKAYKEAASYDTPELRSLGKETEERQKTRDAIRDSYYSDIAKSMTDADKAIQRSSEETSGALEKNSAQVQKSLDSMFREMSKYGKGMDGFSSLVFNNKNGNTDIETMGPMIDEMTKKLGLSEYAAQNFKAAIAGISDEFKGANKDVQQLEQIAKYQDLVSEIMKSEAAVKQLSRAMSDMHMPSDLMRRMYTLSANVKELEASYKALSATGSGLSSIFKSDPTNMEAASQAMNAFSAAEIVANETADRMRQRLEKFDTGAIDRATDSTKSATQQLFDASLAAEQARDSYHTLAGEVQFLEGVQSQLMGKQPVTLSTDPEEADAIRESYGKAVEELDECNAALATLRERAARARSAMESAVEAEEMAKMRKEYEEMSSGATMYASNARKAAEAAREIFVQRSVAETFGDTGFIDRLQERISSLTSSAKAFETAFEFDPKNVDMATASMARLQEAEALAAQRIAELSRATAGFDTSKVDELRDKYGSVTAAVNTLRDAQGAAINKMRDAIANRLSEIDNGYESSMLRSMAGSLMDPNAKFEGFQLDFLPEPIRKAREEMDKFSTSSKEAAQDLADAEKALKFEQMQQQIATARMELEKLMRQEYDIVLRLSLQGEFGDTSKITEALDGAMQSAMGRVGTFDEALKFDTKNVDLLDSRMRAVTDAMNLGTREAASLSAAMSQIDVSAVEEMRSTYGSVSNAVNMTTDAVNDLISKVAEERAKMEAADEGSDAYVKAKASVEALEAELEEAQQASAKAAQYERWERYDEQLAKVRSSMEKLKSDVREVAERNVEAFAANYSEGMFGDIDEQVASFDSAIGKAEERYKRYTELLKSNPTNEGFKADQSDAYDEALRLAEEKAKHIRDAMSGFLDTDFGGMGDRISDILSRYTSFGRAIDDGKTKLKATEAEIETLKQKVTEFAAKNGKSAEWVRQFTDAKAEIKSIPPELEPVRARLVELWNAQGEQQLELAIASVCEHFDDLAVAADAAAIEVKKTLDDAGKVDIDEAAFQQAISEVGQAARQAGQHIVDSANTIDSAYRDMRKTVQATEDQFESLKNKAIEFSQTHAVSADTILEMESLGGQLGVSANALQEFGEVASNLDIATDIDADEIALKLGQITNVMGDLDESTFENFADALVRLGNNTAAQESSIMNVAQRMSSVWNTAKMGTPELLAWSAAIASTGQRSESAATAISNTITGISAAIAAGGSDLENFASIAGMGADEFKKKWEDTSTTSEALKAFIDGLQSLSDTNTGAISALENMGISSVRQETALLGLASTVETLDDALEMSKSAFNGGGDAATEAAQKSEGFSGHLKIMQNNVDDLAASLGDGLLPVIDMITSALKAITGFLDLLDGPMKTAVVTVGGLTAAYATLYPTLNQVSKGWKKLFEEARTSGTESMGIMKKSIVEAANAIKQIFGALSEMPSKFAEARAQNMSLGASFKAMGSSAEAAGLGVKALASSILPLLAITATIAIIGQLVDAYSQWAEHEKLVESATTGLSNAIKSSESVYNQYSQSVGGMVNRTAEEIKTSNEEALRSMSEFSAHVDDTMKSLGTNSAMLDKYVDTILSLGNQSSLSKGEIALLEEAVKGFNDITGASIAIIDEETGKLNIMPDAIKRVTEAYREQAEQKAYAELYSKALQEQAELEYEQAKNQAEYNNLLKDANESYEDMSILSMAMHGELGMLADGSTDRLYELKKAMDENSAATQTAKDTAEHYKGLMDGSAQTVDGVARSITDYSSALASAGMSTSDFTSLTDDEQSKLNQIQAALVAAGMSLTDYGSLNKSELQKIAAAWNGNVKDIVAAIKNIQAASKAANEPHDYTAEANARKKELDREYNDKKKEYDNEYKLQQKKLDREYKAAQKASQKYLKDFKKAQQQEVEAFKAATDAKVKEIEREYEAKQKLLDQEYQRYDSEIDEKIKGIEAEQTAEDEAKKQRERQEKLDELNQKVATARTAKARKEAEKELNDYIEDLRAEDIKAQRDAQIQKLKDQKSALKDQYDDRKKELKDSYDLAVNNYKAQREAELKILQEKQEAEYEMVSESEQAKLEALKESHQNQLEDLKNYHDNRLQEIKDANDAEVQAIKDGNAAKEAAASEHADNMDKIAKDATTKAYQTVDGTMTGMPQKMADKMTAGFKIMQGVATAMAAPLGGTMAVAVNQAVNPVKMMPGILGNYSTQAKNALVNGFTDETATQALQYAAQRLVDAGTDPVKVLPMVEEQFGKDSAWALANGLSDEEATQRVYETTQAIVDANGDIMKVMAILNETYGKDAVVAAANGMNDKDAMSNVQQAANNIMNSSLDPFSKMGQLVNVFMANAMVEGAKGMVEKGELSEEAARSIAQRAAKKLDENKEWSKTSGHNLAINFANGMTSGTAISAAMNAAMTLAGIAASYLHHSTPDKGPLKDDDKWGGELVKNWVDSMRSKFGMLSGTTNQMANLISSGIYVGDLDTGFTQAIVNDMRRGEGAVTEQARRLAELQGKVYNAKTLRDRTKAQGDLSDYYADVTQRMIDDMRSKEGELLRQAQRMSDIVERGFDPKLTVDAAYEAIDRIDRGNLRRQQMVASRQSVDNSTYAPVININIPEMVVREEADIDRISNQIALKVQRQLNSRIG